MIGNDIVDIAKAKEDSNWQRPRFLDIIFTENEQKFIKNSEDSFLTVWHLWSIKEAAYKLYTQINPSRFYNPKKFECSINDTSGVVKFQNFKCITKTKITTDYIFSEASLTPLLLKSKIVEITPEDHKSSSLILKHKLLNSLSENFRISKEKLKITKDEFGIPTVTINNYKQHISLTHHGRFGAFAFIQ